jgi:two-component system phosphate regulon sensor histidine kinase PhoR
MLLFSGEIKSLKKAQENAAQSVMAWQETVYDSMIEGLLLLNDAGRVQLANRAFVRLFATTGDHAGKPLLEVLRWHELADLVAILDAKDRWRSREMRFPGAGELWLQVSAAAILDADQQRHGTILVFHDVTRLKQLERTREEFVANVSHELRTPLSHIKGYVETLLNGAKDDPTVATRFLQTIERNAGRLQLLIEDLLTISELESGRVLLNLQSVSLRNVAGKVFDDFKARAAVRAVTLTNELPEVSVRADAARIEQVLSNLVDNAIKYGRPGGQVVLAARALPENMLEVSVRDDGPGLPPEAMERIFERFYRVDKARSREQGGTGLGLSIVKHIVQSHGGRAWAKSESGKGATFCFTLAQGQSGSPAGVLRPTG